MEGGLLGVTVARVVLEMDKEFCKSMGMPSRIFLRNGYL